MSIFCVPKKEIVFFHPIFRSCSWFFPSIFFEISHLAFTIDCGLDSQNRPLGVKLNLKCIPTIQLFGSCFFAPNFWKIPETRYSRVLMEFCTQRTSSFQVRKQTSSPAKSWPPSQSGFFFSLDFCYPNTNSKMKMKTSHIYSRYPQEQFQSDPEQSEWLLKTCTKIPTSLSLLRRTG